MHPNFPSDNPFAATTQGAAADMAWGPRSSGPGVHSDHPHQGLHGVPPQTPTQPHFFQQPQQPMSIPQQPGNNFGGATEGWGEMGEMAKQYHPMAQMGLQMGNLFVQKRMAGILSWFRLDKLRPYFHVSNTYVLRKLQIIGLPFLTKNYRRSRRRVIHAHSPVDPMSSGGAEDLAGAGSLADAFETPATDPNAPDLYIPLMALITYILLLGFSYAQAASFSPEVLGVTTSSALLLLSLEVAVIKIGFWLIGEECPSYVDLFALLAYRFVGLIVTVIAGLLGGGFAMAVAFCYFSFATAFFVVRSLTASTAPTIEVNSVQMQMHAGHHYPTAGGYPGVASNPGSSSQANSSKRRKLVILGIGVLSLVMSGLLLRSGSP